MGLVLWLIGMSGNRLKIDDSLQRGQFNPKFQVEQVDPTNHFSTDS